MFTSKLLLLEILLFTLLVTICVGKETVTSIEKQAATLPCTSAKAIIGKAQPTLLRWFHQHRHRPVYTLDVRRLDVPSADDVWNGEGSKHFPSPDFDGRLYLELSSDTPSLRIDPVEFEDRGRYTCRVDFRARRSMSNDIDLEVIVPPKGVVIRDQRNHKVEGAIGPFNLRESLGISCEAIGGIPVPTLTWSGNFDGAIEFNDSSSISSISIPFLRRQNQWSQFTCSASNNNLTTPKSVTVIIEINLPPLDVILKKNFKEPLTAGQQVEFVCLAIGSHPRAHVMWFLDGVLVTSSEAVSDNGNVTRSVHRRNISSEDDNKVLECQISNPSIPSVVMKKNYLLEVHYKPELLLTIQGTDANNSVVEGNTIAIRCESRSRPPSLKKIWFHDGLKMSEEGIVVAEDGGLFIEEVKKSQAGKYTCESGNSEGSSTASIHVDVQHVPICRNMDLPLDRRGRSARVVLNATCDLISNPSDVTFYWTVSGTSSNRSWTTGVQSRSELRLDENVTQILCWGRNAVGVQQIPCVFLLSEEKMTSPHTVDVVFLCFVAMVCLGVFFLLCRRVCRPDQRTSNVLLTNARNLKETGCTQMINNCVKSANSTGENECLNNLLTPEQKKVRRHSPDVQETSLSCYTTTEPDATKYNVQYRRKSHQKQRRTQSSQF